MRFGFPPIRITEWRRCHFETVRKILTAKPLCFAYDHDRICELSRPIPHVSNFAGAMGQVPGSLVCPDDPGLVPRHFLRLHFQYKSKLRKKNEAAVSGGFTRSSHMEMCYLSWVAM